MERASFTRFMEFSSSLPIFSLRRCLSIVRTCSKSTTESFMSPEDPVSTSIWVGRFALSRWLVIAAAITVGLNLFPIVLR